MKARAVDKSSGFPSLCGKNSSAKKRFYTFGVLTTVAKDIFRSRYHAELLSGIFQRAAALGHELKIFTLPKKLPALLDAILREHGLDGLFILTWRWIHPEIVRLIETSHHKRVLVFNDPVPDLGVNIVYTDTDAGMAQAVSRLVKNKYRKIGVLHGPLSVPFVNGKKKVLVPFIDTRLKEQGFLKALKAKGVRADKKWIRSGNANTEHEGYQVMKKWLEEKDLPEGIVCGNDDLAFGALRAIQETGKHIPQDMAVIGFDDNGQAKSFSPPLTTVRQPLVQMGRDAVDILVWQIECPSSRPVSRKYLPRLVVRKTA